MTPTKALNPLPGRLWRRSSPACGARLCGGIQFRRFDRTSRFRGPLHEPWSTLIRGPTSQLALPVVDVIRLRIGVKYPVRHWHRWFRQVAVC